MKEKNCLVLFLAFAQNGDNKTRHSIEEESQSKVVIFSTGKKRVAKKKRKSRKKLTYLD